MTTRSESQTIERAKLVASILTDNGIPVSSPDDCDLDDVERERWNACVEIVRELAAIQKGRQP